jgi:hypothetical protein
MAPKKAVPTTPYMPMQPGSAPAGPPAGPPPPTPRGPKAPIPWSPFGNVAVPVTPARAPSTAGDRGAGAVAKFVPMTAAQHRDLLAPKAPGVIRTIAVFKGEGDARGSAAAAPRLPNDVAASMEYDMIIAKAKAKANVNANLGAIAKALAKAEAKAKAKAKAKAEAKGAGASVGGEDAGCRQD